MVEIIDKAKDKVKDNTKDVKDKVVDNTKDVVGSAKDSFSAPSIDYSYTSERKYKEIDPDIEIKKTDPHITEYGKESTIAGNIKENQPATSVISETKFDSQANNNSNSSAIIHTKYSHNTNNQNNRDFKDSINRALDQTKDNINKSIDESKNQIPRYNDIVNSYQEQSLQVAREISENFIESQKSIIRSIQSAWRPYQQNYSSTINSWNSPEAVANVYSRFVSTVADNTVAALRTTNNLVFASLDAYKTTMEHAKDTTKQIFEINSNAAKTFEQNSREVTRAAAQDASSNLNTSVNSGSGSSSNTGTSSTFRSEA